MRKVKTFFHVFTHSLLPTSEYYHKLIRTKLYFSLLYFTAFIVLLHAFFFLLSAIKINPFTLTSTLNNLNTSLERYPEDLIISINDGSLTSNTTKPYFLWLDYKNSKHLLLVVDEFATPEKIYDYGSLILLTSTRAIMRNIKNGSFERFTEFRYPNDQYITKSTIQDVQNVIRYSALFIFFLYPFTAVILFSLGLLFTFLKSFLYLFISAFLSYIILRILNNKHEYSFSKTLKVSFHAVTLPFILYFFLKFFFSTGFPAPALFSILLIIFIFSGIHESLPLKTHLKSHKRTS